MFGQDLLERELLSLREPPRSVLPVEALLFLLGQLFQTRELPIRNGQQTEEDDPSE